ncbi:replication initiation factor domain-containing protein, partial [Kingella kingae]|uniref:replication initiation factor domain-containing protein n=1 Tax=Kingella kingae TaxID=504 RepID=UPI001E45F65B
NFDMSNTVYKTFKRCVVSAFQNPEYFSYYITNEKGDLIEIPLRRGQSNGAFIDYIRFTCDVTALNKNIVFSDLSVSLDEQVIELSRLIFNLFGFGIVGERLGKGKFFYENYYQLGTKEANYGEVHIGGNGGKFLVSINGTGCQAACTGWEQKFYDFAQSENLRQPNSFYLSRADVAKDYFNGEYTPEQSYLDWSNGLFDVRNARPKFSRTGTDWECNDNTGKTAYIGTRKHSSKYTRIYEKGKQLGDKNSQWVRFEIEFRKSKSREQKFKISIDILINSGQYLSGAYEQLYSTGMFDGEQKRIDYMNQAATIIFESKLKYAKQQVGAMIRLLLDIGWDTDKICHTLVAEAGKYPKGLDPAVYNAKQQRQSYLHDNAGVVLDANDKLFMQFHTKMIELQQQEYQMFRDDDKSDYLNEFIRKQNFDIWRKQNQTDSYRLEKDLTIWQTSSNPSQSTDWILLKYNHLLNKE